jgi:lipid-binding SYLF domain-containing protein
MRVEGGSFGFQIGVSDTHVAVLVMTNDGINHLLSDKFRLRGDATVAAGPIRRDTSAETDDALQAEMLSYSHGVCSQYLAGRGRRFVPARRPRRNSTATM